MRVVPVGVDHDGVPARRDVACQDAASARTSRSVTVVLWQSLLFQPVGGDSPVVEWTA